MGEQHQAAPPGETAMDTCFSPELLDVDVALAKLLEQAVPITHCETVPLDNARHRILGQEIRSPIDVPPFNCSVMDGYAFNSDDLLGAPPWRIPVNQHISAGHPGQPLTRGTAARILTGAALPPGANTVLPQECCDSDAGHIVIPNSVTPGNNIRPLGSHIGKGAAALHPGVCLRPAHIGLAASLGITQLPVMRRLRVALLTTGDELVEPGLPLRDGQIYNSNRYMLAALINALGCELVEIGAIPDTIDDTRNALQHAAQSDLIITSGGVSVGDEDHVKNAVTALGRLEIWRIRLKPGKPFAFGYVQNTPFLGLPGNPLSGLTTFCLFARPFILKRQGAVCVRPNTFPVAAGFERANPNPRREYLAAKLVRDENNALVAIGPTRQDSASLIGTTTADGLLCLPENRSIAKGDMLDFTPYSELMG